MHDPGLGRVLLTLARGAIAARFGHVPRAAEHDALGQPGATFVTLKCQGALRGCIGTLEAVRPLGQDVQRNALAAAFADPRFAPLAAGELEAARVEVSLLAPPEPIPCVDEDDLLTRLRPGVDGLVLSYRGHRGTFLPQVWESLPEPGVFVRELKRKAGLPSDFWHPSLAVARYEVAKWSEDAIEEVVDE